MEVVDGVVCKQGISSIHKRWQVRVAGLVQPRCFLMLYGSYFLSAAGPAVKIYSVATGNLVSTLSPLGTSSHPPQPTGYGDEVSSMALNPHNAFQLYTGSLDGCIRVWDLIDAILLQTIDVADPIMQLAVHEKFKNEIYVSISRRTKALNGNSESHRLPIPSR